MSDFTFTFHFHALEKEMATHSSVLAWRIPGMGEPGGLPSVGSHRVGHDWSDLAEAAAGSHLPKEQASLSQSLDLFPRELPPEQLRGWCACKRTGGRSLQRGRLCWLRPRRPSQHAPVLAHQEAPPTLQTLAWLPAHPDFLKYTLMLAKRLNTLLN